MHPQHSCRACTISSPSRDSAYLCLIAAHIARPSYGENIMKVVFEGVVPEGRPQTIAQKAIVRAPKKSRVQLRLFTAAAPLFHAL
jgi:hypothetical protein